jgi:outer membrane murein-binding lipoprotein Lpp
VLRDYAHASKLFVGSNFRLLPKTGFLFHVFFDINPDVLRISPDPSNPNSEREIGLMVKSVDLPRFSLDTKTFNAYNRPNLVQSKIRYDSINVVFHDDSANLIRKFWENYFTYYYKDTQSDVYVTDSITDLTIPHKYGSYFNKRYVDFGFTPKTLTPYLRSIRIYSLHQNAFSEYVLINPLIKNFRHGQHLQGESVTLTHEMQVEYEGVLYSTGRITESEDDDGIKEFAKLHYDNTPSTYNYSSEQSINNFKDTKRTAPDKVLGLNNFTASRVIQENQSQKIPASTFEDINNLIINSSFNSAQNLLVPTGIGNSRSLIDKKPALTSSTSTLPLAGTTPITPIESETKQNIAPAPIVDSDDPKVVKEAILTLERFKQVVINTLNQYQDPTSTRSQSVSPRARENMIRHHTSGIEITNGMIKRGKQQLERLTNNTGTNDVTDQVQNIDKQINGLEKDIDSTAKKVASANRQITTANTNIGLFNNKLSQAQGLPDSDTNKQTLISQHLQSINKFESLRDINQIEYTVASDQLVRKTIDLNELRLRKTILTQ